MSDTSKTPLSYRDAGVDIEAGERLVEAIGPLAKATARAGVMGGILSWFLAQTASAPS